MSRPSAPAPAGTVSRILTELATTVGPSAKLLGHAAGTLEWTVAETIEHLVDVYIWYAVQLASAAQAARRLDAKPPHCASNSDRIQSLAAAGALLDLVLEAVPPGQRGWHPSGSRAREVPPHRSCRGPHPWPRHLLRSRSGVAAGRRSCSRTAPQSFPGTQRASTPVRGWPRPRKSRCAPGSPFGLCTSVWVMQRTNTPRSIPSLPSRSAFGDLCLVAPGARSQRGLDAIEILA